MPHDRGTTRTQHDCKLANAIYECWRFCKPLVGVQISHPAPANQWFLRVSSSRTPPLLRAVVRYFGFAALFRWFRAPQLIFWGCGQIALFDRRSILRSFTQPDSGLGRASCVWNSGTVFKRYVLCLHCKGDYLFTLRAIAHNPELRCHGCGGSIRLSDRGLMKHYSAM